MRRLLLRVRSLDGTTKRELCNILHRSVVPVLVIADACECDDEIIFHCIILVS